MSVRRRFSPESCWTAFRVAWMPARALPPWSIAALAAANGSKTWRTSVMSANSVMSTRVAKVPRRG
ncbi:hypothetical protein D3C74_502920 [compost metagenome]